MAVAGTYRVKNIPFGKKHFSSTSGGSFFQVSIENESPANGAICTVSRQARQLSIYVASGKFNMLEKKICSILWPKRFYNNPILILIVKDNIKQGNDVKLLKNVIQN